MSFAVAIDGPAAAGKGTIGRALAEAFDFAYLDTGLLYRAVGLRHLAGEDPVAAAKALEAAPRELLYLEAFLLPLIAELTLEHSSVTDTAPDWLTQALQAAEHPDVFRDGAAGFVAQCGKAHAHVARVMQAHLGQTPSDFINGKRMDYAARQLKGTPDSLSEIAQDVGIANMSHFHRLFRARFDMTPRQYRVKHQKGVIQPV